MITGSWDATVKVWSIEEGRGGWAASFSSVSGNTGSWLRQLLVVHISTFRCVFGHCRVWSCLFFCLVKNVHLVDAERVPECEIFEHEVAVWSLDVSENGHLAVSGAEDGDYAYHSSFLPFFPKFGCLECTKKVYMWIGDARSEWKRKQTSGFSFFLPILSKDRIGASIVSLRWKFILLLNERN